ncbi:MAG: hypothetical protein E6G60_17685 [Actinobacteria bacterium]|nr:MAG: hypothetical protein E6G60_17685 [Actinomycetota bacterium]
MVETSLALCGPRPPEWRLDGDFPAAAELVGQLFRRVMAAPEPSVAVGRDERDDVGVRPGNGFDDELRSPGAQPPQAPLLPRSHDPADGLVVLHGCARLREGEPPSGTFAAARDRPRRRRATTAAMWRTEPAQVPRARVADLGAAPRAP